MLFIAIGASIRTFMNHLRPFLIIDAAHLKGLYKGTNLLAIGMDGNNQIVPVAFGICKWETDPCWSWWIVESVNACIVLKRKLPITTLTETYHAMVQEWYFKRREVAANMKYEIIDWVADKVQKRKMKSAAWIVNGINHY
ncbi:transposase, MuDR, MULE transposase domain protein [Tanacetum coccineum]